MTFLFTCSLEYGQMLRPKYVGVSFIQSDSVRKVSTLGGGGIGHCEKKFFYEHVSNCDCLSR